MDGNLYVWPVVWRFKEYFLEEITKIGNEINIKELTWLPVRYMNEIMSQEDKVGGRNVTVSKINRRENLEWTGMDRLWL